MQSRNTSTPVQSACASACALHLGASRHGAGIAPAGDRGRGRRRGRPYPCGGIRLQAGQRVRRPQRGAAAALPGGTAHVLRQLRRAAGCAARRARAQGDLLARVPRGRRRVAGACATRQPLTRPPPPFSVTSPVGSSAAGVLLRAACSQRRDVRRCATWASAASSAHGTCLRSCRVGLLPAAQERDGAPQWCPNLSQGSNSELWRAALLRADPAARRVA